MTRPVTAYCPAHDLEAGVACPVPGGACRDRIIAAGTENPVRDLWRAAVAAFEGSSKAEADRRDAIEPTVNGKGGES